MYFVICKDLEERGQLIKHLKDNNIHSVFHYLSLHKSEYQSKESIVVDHLPQADMYSDCLLRLPMFYDLSTSDVAMICQNIVDFYKNK